ncbi:hypothetical protein PSHI8_07080 [Polynucleobacter sp. SHI8]|uniref:hypothetical protein n=1 Tax=unclassified Polynucleobacter TaxID=2640945 RepID=UPI00249013EC|nr:MULTISPECIES: hypothetical protein [unclassified Polynucleobacter]BDW10626.1 hypothetical protein PSHI2_07080 [Polynucleobacter sp. SHI2]BDW13072.1 hypothetical protein PSHI8_07080 [Polynucleobacter sp. SHI8]
MSKKHIYCSLVILLALSQRGVFAHGIAGNRYFPPTISIDDPFAAKEIHAGAGRVSSLGTNNEMANQFMIGGGIEPMDGFGIAIDGVYRSPNANLTPEANGFDNLYYTVKKELTINDQHEFALTLGVNGQIGGTAPSVSSNASTYTPTIYYAKGFGDLPNSMSLLKPMAITGVLGYQASTNQSQPTAFNWGFTIQYSFLYLNKYVQPTGWGEPWNRLVAVVEFPLQTCMSGMCNGQVTGSMNPGVVWVGSEFNLSAEAVFPINNQSGQGKGILFQIHKFLGK